MNKIFMFFCILSMSYYTNAQCDSTLPVSESFSNISTVNSCWNFIDANGDGYGWNIVNVSGNNVLKSASHISGVEPFSPDNWAISQPINLTSVSNATLTWKVRATFWNYDRENYTVYVSTGSQISNFLNNGISFSENLAGNRDYWVNRSLNVSAFVGQTIYIAIRHHNAYDQYQIDFDDVSVTGNGGSGCTVDSDGDGVCDSDDQCPGFDDAIDTNNNGIPDGCENSTSCNEQTVYFSSNSLTHSGTGTNSITKVLPTGSQNITFTISGIDEKTKGKESDKYIERIKVTYKDGSGITKTNGTYRGDQVSSATINIPGEVESITVILDDAYDGNADSTLSVDLGSVKYCPSTTPCPDSDGDGVCDADDKCPGKDDLLDSNGNGIPDGCESTCTSYIASFNKNPLTHSGKGSSTATVNLPANSQNISFSISDIGSKEKGRLVGHFIEHVVVTYVDGSGVVRTYGTYNGLSFSSVTVNINGIVKSIAVNLSDELSGLVTLSVDVSDVSYCVTGSPSTSPSSSKENTLMEIQNESFPSENSLDDGLFNIYPNPASKKFYVKNSGLLDTNAYVSLYNINGTQVRSYSLSDKYTHTYELDINGLPTGLYILRFSSDTGILLKTGRLIIK